MFLVVLETAKSEVEFEIEKTDLSIKVNYITIPSDADWGTADSLRHLSSYIIVSILRGIIQEKVHQFGEFNFSHVDGIG